jgi:hypothetical protein
MLARRLAATGAIAFVLALAGGADAARWEPTRLSPFPEPPRVALSDEVVAALRDARCAEPPIAAEERTAGLSAAVIQARIEDDPASLGSASFGRPTRGALWGGVQLEASERIYPFAAAYAWGTASTVASLERAARIVGCRFPGTVPLPVGSISKERGGPLFPSRSHQSGLDADVAYYAVDGTWFQKTATAKSLDRKRTWALIEALVGGGNVEYLFIDRRVQALLRPEAEAVSPPELVRDLFDGTLHKQPIIRHAHGHSGHLHVRFFDEGARRAAPRVAPYVKGPRRFLLQALR